ncbi:alpha/beta hydrolase [Paraflavitalea sp. CAU 1676]|uniref:alpha/beta fold hydrolase n=1 Tax=Paraflavitalea sp. CAU 1676 TaxID=3032598 RepID=UPI0023DB7769|nr:alpha/beta hydrolase [Paraflavitalea sp. CAU 1676]MDF2188631.1 alpha/beta hydrolase [Paraflavitalea sp. CAU 1676]
MRFMLCGLLLALFPGNSLLAQKITDYHVLKQTVIAQPYWGKKIKLQAAVRLVTKDTATKAGLWLRVDKPDHTAGFFRNTWDEPKHSSTWRTVTIEGFVVEDATNIVFGGVFAGKAQFYLDDFNLSVDDNGTWVPIPIANPSFEDTTPAANANWLVFHNSVKQPIAFSQQQPVNGHSTILIASSQGATGYAYGSNPDAGKYADINGIRLYYEIYGKGEPLLLLHGNGQNIQELAQQIEFFKDKFQVIAVDTRGQGKSSADSTRFTYHLFASDMYELLKQLRIKNVNIVGWSDGGNTGLILAMQHPGLVKKLATMGANIFMNQEAVIPIVFTEIDNQLKEFAKDSSAKGRMNTRLMNLLLQEPHMQFTDLRAIRCPVLVMAGENDLIQEAHTRGIAQHIKAAELVIFPKASHYIPQENAPLYNKTVWEFLQKP